MLSAPTRSGKGVGVVIPNLLNWPDSVVVLDIKGENFDITAGYRAEHGQAVYAFSPFDEDARSHRWNPLSTVRTSPLHRVGDLLAIGQVFFPNDGGSTSSEAFFNDQARNLFLGLGLYLLETPDLPRTIGEMLRQSSGKGQPLKDHFDGGDHAAAGGGQAAVRRMHRRAAAAAVELGEHAVQHRRHLQCAADDLRRCGGRCGHQRRRLPARGRAAPAHVDLRAHPAEPAGQRPAAAEPVLLAAGQPEHPARCREQDPALKVQCLLVNDEFTAMGRVGVITSAAAFLAGYNLRLLTVVQAMSQLDAVYGDKEARTFATNHGLQILYAPREQRDADEYSAMLGHFTERATSRGRSRSFSGHGHTTVSRNESDQRRALLLPQEFKELGTERLVVVMENCKPILGEKIRYHRDKVFTARLLPPPAVPAMDMDLHFARVQQRWRYAPDELAGRRRAEASSSSPTTCDRHCPTSRAADDTGRHRRVARPVLRR